MFYKNTIVEVRVKLMVFNATFNNISAILWWSVLLMEEIRVPRENHRSVANFITKLYRVHPAMIRIRTHNFSLFCRKNVNIKWTCAGFATRDCHRTILGDAYNIFRQSSTRGEMNAVHGLDPSIRDINDKKPTDDSVQ